MWKVVWQTEENKCHHIGARGYKITLHHNEDLHAVGNRKEHLLLCDDLGCGDFQSKAVTLTEAGTVSTPVLQAQAASNSRAILTCVLLDQPPIRIQPDCGASCYVTPQHWKAATWDWKSGHTLVMHNKAIQKPASKCGLSRRNTDTCMCHLLWSKLRPDLCTTPPHPQPGRGNTFMIPFPTHEKMEVQKGKWNNKLNTNATGKTTERTLQTGFIIAL